MKKIAALVLALCLVACGKPVPADKSAYVGNWQAPNMMLQISQDGNVRYERKDGSTSTKVDAGLKEFNGDNFTVGFGPITTEFKVTAPPHQVEEDMKMTVDGVELTKAK